MARNQIQAVVVVQIDQERQTDWLDEKKEGKGFISGFYIAERLRHNIKFINKTIKYQLSDVND